MEYIFVNLIVLGRLSIIFTFFAINTHAASLSRDDEFSKLSFDLTINESTIRTQYSTIHNQAISDKTQASNSSRTLSGKIFEICVKKSDVAFNTVRIRGELLSDALISAGGKHGNCEDICEDICFHQKCEMSSFKYGGTCICNQQQKSICGDKMQCTNGQCECIDGYNGNMLQGCKKEEIQWLTQRDFDNGTVILDKSGLYYLAEDITFCPVARPFSSVDIPSDIFQPILPHAEYDEYAFSLGFPSAIAVTGDKIKINLNGHTLQQCDGHLLTQRFFALISLALQPFTANNGPHNFVNPRLGYRSAKNVVISGPGKLGRTAHHGIFGNENANVVIKDIVFEGYEVAAVHFNQIDGLLIEGCTILGTRKDVPVVGMFSAGVFIRPYIKDLARKGYSMTLRNSDVMAQAIYDELSYRIDNVYSDVVQKGEIDAKLHPIENELFGNPLKLPEGSCYGILIYGHGPASNGFASELEDVDSSSKNITIRNNTVSGLKCYTKEYPVVVGHESVVVDARGAVFQFQDTFKRRDLALNQTDGSYVGNIVSDAQVMVAKAIIDGIFRKQNILQNKVNTIRPWIIRWAEGKPMNNSKPGKPTLTPKYRCHGDSMHHVSKGIVGIRLEETVGFVIHNNVIEKLENLSPPDYLDCSDYHAEADEESQSINQAANIRAISISAARGFVNGSLSRVSYNTINTFKSKNAKSIIGIDIRGDTESVEIIRNNVDATNTGTSTARCASLVIGGNTDNSTVRILRNRLNPPPTFHNNSKLHRILNVRSAGEYGCPFSR